MRREKTGTGGGHVRRDFVTGLFLIALMVFIKAALEHTPVGHQLEHAGYDWLQRRLSAGSVPVALVDIKDLGPARFDLDGQTGVATPRRELLALLEAVVERGASAVSLDVDFSQERDGNYITPRDPEFFRSCLDMSRRTGVPVFLGIKRAESSPPELWLGAGEFAGLAANITVPKVSPVVKMPKWVRPSEEAADGKTMGAALAGGYQVSQSGLLDWLARRGLVEQFREKELGHGVGVGEFPVDYSPLEALVEGRLKTKDPRAVRDSGDLLRGKIVLIGNGTDCGARDCFAVPGREEPFPGVYLHASAAYTLTRAPLFELTWPGRLAADALLALAVLLGVTCVQLLARRLTRREVAAHGLQIFFTALVMAAAFVGGVMFVGATRLMWSDFIMVLLALLLHPPAHRLFEKVRGRLAAPRGKLFHGEEG